MVTQRSLVVAFAAILVGSCLGNLTAAAQDDDSAARQPIEPEAGDPGGPPEWASIFQTVQSGRCGEAVPMLESYLRAYPDAARAHYFLGFCEGRQGHDKEALAALERASEIRPDMEGVAVMRGKLLLRLGRSADAEQAFKDEIAVATTPEVQLEAWTALADHWTRFARNAEARDAWTRVIELAPKRADAYAQASALDLKLDRLEEADAILRQGEAAGVQNPTARLNVGIAAFNKKDLGRAGEIFLAVAEGAGAAKDVAAAWGLLAKVQMRDGRDAEAAVSIKKSLETAPDGPMAAELREVLKRIEPISRKR